MSAATCYYRLAATGDLRLEYSTSDANAAVAHRELPNRSAARYFLAEEARRLARMVSQDLVLELARQHFKDSVWQRGDVDIRSRSRNLGIRPQIYLRGRRLSWSLSISHTADYVLVALCMDPGVVVGADVVTASRLGPGFEQLWFTPAERQWLRLAEDPRQPFDLWAIKEAAFKALNRGEPFAPRAIEAVPQPGGRFQIRWHGRPWPNRIHVALFGIERARAAVVTAHGSQRIVPLRYTTPIAPRWAIAVGPKECAGVSVDDTI